MSLTPKQVKDALKKHGSGRKAAEALGVPRTTFQDAVQRMRQGQLGGVELVERREEKRPRRGYVKRYIFTSAQDQTPVSQPYWDNLVAFAEYCGAEIIVAGFTYTTRNSNPDDFDERVRPYLTNAQINVGDRLLFCGEINISPTASQPLSGLETYTRNKWGVFPHPRVELKSIATMFTEPSKQIMTTGCCTQPNYLPRKAGVKAEFHHVIGALLVEIDGSGDVFARHLLADASGGFYDLETYVFAGAVTTGHYVDSITWGDIHAEHVDPEVAAVSWGVDDSILDTLEPSVQFVHDLQDFSARNHHNIKDPHWRFKMFESGTESVEADLKRVAGVLQGMRRDGCETVIVESNHDLALARWLRDADFRDDPVNALFYLDATRATYDAMQRKETNFSVFEWAIKRLMFAPREITFLREYSSYKRNGIEHALHGHKGANGAKGHLNSFAKMGSKANVAHTHSAAIHEGIYQAGTSSKLDLGYNRGGLSSWNHAHIINYLNGKRTIITIQNGKWRA